jgi:hypothetical protein
MPRTFRTSFASPAGSHRCGNRTARECGRNIVGTYTHRPFRLPSSRPRFLQLSKAIKIPSSETLNHGYLAWQQLTPEDGRRSTCFNITPPKRPWLLLHLWACCPLMTARAHEPYWAADRWFASGWWSRFQLLRSDFKSKFLSPILLIFF